MPSTASTSSGVAPYIARHRLHVVDELRGLAIFIMAAANMMFLLNVSEVPYLLRWFFSLAAPIFVALSGLMVAWSIYGKNYQRRKLLRRAAFLLFCGFAVDVFVWRIIPFTTVDVLYLIACGVAVSTLLARFSSYGVLVLAGIMLGMGEILREMLGYLADPVERDLTWPLNLPDWELLRQHWLVDGWFPLFPWLGMSLFGLWLGQVLWREGVDRHAPVFLHPLLLVVAPVLFATGVALEVLHPSPMLIRGNGYYEVFYPPTSSFCLITVGILILIGAGIEKIEKRVKLKALAIPGRCSLLLYIMHLIIVGQVLEFFYPAGKWPFWAWISTYLLLASLLIAVAFGLEALRTRRLAKKTAEKPVA
jgi:uncharacterized membrane protein